MPKELKWNANFHSFASRGYVLAVEKKASQPPKLIAFESSKDRMDWIAGDMATRSTITLDKATAMASSAIAGELGALAVQQQREDAKKKEVVGRDFNAGFAAAVDGTKPLEQGASEYIREKLADEIDEANRTYEEEAAVRERLREKGLL